MTRPPEPAPPSVPDFLDAAAAGVGDHAFDTVRTTAGTRAVGVGVERGSSVGGGGLTAARRVKRVE